MLQNIALAIRLAGAGLSRSQIAVRIAAETGCKISRSAVVGLLHRRGVGAVARPKPVQRSRRGNLPVAGKLPAMTFTIRSRAKSALRNADLKPPDCEPVALLSIGDDRCHWPIDDGHGLDLLMCASKTDGTSSYCSYHHRISLAQFAVASVQRRHVPRRAPPGRLLEAMCG
jgi:hypothetical protein